MGNGMKPKKWSRPSWQDDLMLKRYEMVRARLVEGKKVLDICRSFNTTLPTLYKWIHRFEEGGIQALADRSHARHNTNQIPEQVRDAIVELRREDSWRSCYEIADILKERNMVVTARTVSRVLRRSGLPRVKPSLKKTPARRASKSSRLRKRQERRHG
jgi:transposase